MGLFLILGAILQAFIYLLVTVPYLAIAILIASIISIFMYTHKIAGELIERGGTSSFFTYAVTYLTTVMMIYITAGIVGSYIDGQKTYSGIHLREGNKYIINEIQKKIHKGRTKA